MEHDQFLGMIFSFRVGISYIFFKLNHCSFGLNQSVYLSFDNFSDIIYLLFRILSFLYLKNI